MDEGLTPEPFDEEEMRRWFTLYGPGVLAPSARFDQTRFFNQEAPTHPRRHWMEWGSAVALVMVLLGGAHFLSLSDHRAASSGGTALQFQPLHTRASSPVYEPPAGAANGPAFAPVMAAIPTSVYKNSRFHFSVALPTFFTRVPSQSSANGAIWHSVHPLAEVQVYGQINALHRTASAWIRQLGPESLLQRGRNWVLASRVHVVNGVKTVTEDKVFLGLRVEDILQIQYPLRDQGQDRTWAQRVVQSFRPGPL